MTYAGSVLLQERYEGTVRRLRIIRADALIKVADEVLAHVQGQTDLGLSCPDCCEFGEGLLIVRAENGIARYALQQHLLDEGCWIARRIGPDPSESAVA